MTSTSSNVEAIVSNLQAIVNGAVVQENLSASDVTSLADAYAAVHVSQRGKVQASVIGQAMTQDGANTDTIVAILAVFTNVSDLATKATRRSDVENVTLTQANLLAAFYVASQVLAETMTPEAIVLASAMVENGLTGEHLDKVLAQASAIVTSTQAKATGTRVTYKETLETLIERGDVEIGQELTDSDGNVATVLSATEIDVNGTVLTGDKPLSAAAQHVTGHSTNGWAYWNVEADKAIGSLRQA